MRAAIYARYSSENQSEKGIDDQIRVCKNYIEEHGMTLSDEHIYIDEAVSGSIINRPGLQALDKALENKEFEEAGHPHCRSLCSLFFRWKHSGWFRIPTDIKKLAEREGFEPSKHLYERLIA